ncbi:DNA polymerase ligase N-terminal domain-containing protein [Streptomyces sp. NPDC002851]
MKGEGGLSAYRRKRDFERTREPPGDEGAGPSAAAGREPVFVVQIHDASTLHFDFRLEVDGVLKSWSIPKGPSTDPHDKRLAMPTEDHPMEYREFEGVIPEGDYGGGTVIVWDEGTYRPLPPKKRKDRDASFAERLANGHVTFWMDGKKLHGGYGLTRFRTQESEGRESWLLVKENDERAGQRGAPDPRRARSARSGRTLRQVAAEEGDEGDEGEGG